MVTNQQNTMHGIMPVDAVNPLSESIASAVEVLKSGGVIMFPTHSVYGLGADALNFDAVEKVFNIKQRSFDNPLLVLVDSIDGMQQLAQQIPDSAWQLMENFWPGGVTLIFKARQTVLNNLTGGTGKIGIRMPEHPVARALCRQMGGPITATSANFSGTPAYERVDKMDKGVAGRLDLILDAGILSGGVGSTVVDVTCDPPEILRQGRIHAAAIYAALG